MILSAFKTYVKQNFKRTDKDTELVQAYNDSCIAISAQLPIGAYKYQSYLPLVAEQEDYPVPGNFMYILHPLRLLDGSASTDSGYPLNHITKQKYDILYPNPNRTSPPIVGATRDYCLYSESFLIGPLPESGTDDLLEIDWVRVLTDQSADNDTPGLPDHWREVLKQMTLKRLYEGIELFQEATYWRSLYEDKEGNPIGIYKRFLDVERGNEGRLIGQVHNNYL